MSSLKSNKTLLGTEPRISIVSHADREARNNKKVKSKQSSHETGTLEHKNRRWLFLTYELIPHFAL